MRRDANPPGGTGYYSSDGTRWWDDATACWYPTMLERDELEIVVEEVGEHSVPLSVLSTMGGTCGSAYSWFVARATSADPRWRVYTVTGDSFPVMRMQPFDKLDAREPFSAEAREALDRLRRKLEEEGWIANGRGEHWWSYRYTRPVVDWASPEGSTLQTQEPARR